MTDLGSQEHIKHATERGLGIVHDSLIRQMFKERRPFSSEDAEAIFEQEFDRLFKVTRDGLRRMEDVDMTEYGVVPFEPNKSEKAQKLADIFQKKLEQSDSNIYVNIDAADLRASIAVARALKHAGKVIFNGDVIKAVNSHELIEDVAIKKILSKGRGGITELAFNVVNTPGLKEQSLAERYKAGSEVIEMMTDGLFQVNQDFYKAKSQVTDEERLTRMDRTRRANHGSYNKEYFLQSDRWEKNFEVAATTELRAMLLIQDRLNEEIKQGTVVDFRMRPGSAEEDVLASTDLITDVVYANGERIQTRFQIKSQRRDATIQNSPGTVLADQYTFDPINKRYFEHYDLVNHTPVEGKTFYQFREDLERSRMAGQLGYLSDAVYKDDTTQSTAITGKHNQSWPAVHSYRGAWVQLIVYN